MKREKSNRTASAPAMRQRASLAASSVVAILTVALAAGCGSIGNGGAQPPSGSKPASAGASNSAAAMAASAAKARLATLVVDNGAINVTQPLPRAPKKGLTAYYLVLNTPTTLPLQKGFEQAMAAIGWTPKIILVSATDPLGFSSGVQEAVAAKANYIIIAAATITQLGSSAKLAKQAGIPILDQYSTDPLSDKSDDIYLNEAGAAWEDAVLPAALDWAIADSGGHAHVLFITISIPIMNSGSDANAAYMKKYCPTTCSYSALVPPASDLANGMVPQDVVTYLQSHPDINYVDAGFGDMATGVQSALDAAGMGSKVKIIGDSLNPSQVATIPSGAIAAATLNPQDYAMWLLVDAMARMSEGLTVDPATYSLLPIKLADQSDLPSQFPAGQWLGPKGFQATFERLWHAG